MTLALILLLLALLLALLLYLPIALDRRRKPMDATARRDAPGDFVRLSQGVTHFQWVMPEANPTKAPVAVLVHGFSTPLSTWDHLAPELARMGYRVLMYDLYGRGYSDRVDGPEGRDFFLTQLNDLLNDQGITRPFTLVGYSMGGAIAAAFAARWPERLDQLVLLAPAGMGAFPQGMLKRSRDSHLPSDWLMLALYPGVHKGAAKALKLMDGTCAHAAQDHRDQLNYAGYMQSLLASLRGILRDEMRPEHSQLQRTNLPVLAVWGGSDIVIPLECMGTLAHWNRSVVHVEVPGASHWLPLTHASEVAQAIRDFDEAL
ncbi:alpha/beta fold hydrolase [Maritimibacter alkaliphilus]|uniref:alpha/beta fold hydrolase n=1 Tax=Maritimibacter alkaliphilus TaxID=404236 RepID=UPI001C97FA60|nr:alpha/beta hydrolase [Maritimibacter alkaliphilus]MBY6093069.1 alpha/beta hydrolase [Maritimibacter alkaliphilus]